MDIISLSGNTCCTIDLIPGNSYTYQQLKQSFKTNIASNWHYCIVQNDEQIFTDLYDIKDNMNKNFILYNLNIIFYNYSKEDTDKIISSDANNTFFNRAYFIPNITLQERFNLSQPDLHNDETFMMFCISINGGLLYYGSDKIKNNSTVINTPNVLYRVEDMYNYISDELKDDKNFIMNNLRAFRHASDRLKDDEELVEHIVIHSPDFFYFVSNKIKNNKTLIMKYFNQIINSCMINKYKLDSYIAIFKNMGVELKNDIELINNFIEFEKQIPHLMHHRTSTLEYVGDELKNNKEIVNKYLELADLYTNMRVHTGMDYGYTHAVYNHIGYELKYDIEIIKRCLKMDHLIILSIPNDLELDKNLIYDIFYDIKYHKKFASYEYDGILRCIPSKYHEDKEIVMIAIEAYHNNYFSILSDLENDIDVIIKAIECCYNDDNTDIYEEYDHDGRDNFLSLTNILLKNLEDKNIDIESINLPQEIITAINYKLSK